MIDDIEHRAELRRIAGRAYRDIDAARAEIANFIDDVYNRNRLYSALGDRPPAEFKAQLPPSGQPSPLAVIPTWL